jgi:alpha-L-fucosidase 2
MRFRSSFNFELCALLLGSGLGLAQDGNALKLWYRQPAGAWTQALPVGNGRLAAMVFGTVRKEHIQFNEDTVWSGEKRDRSNPESPKALPEIRRPLMERHPA